MQDEIPHSELKRASLWRATVQPMTAFLSQCSRTGHSAPGKTSCLLPCPTNEALAEESLQLLEVIPSRSFHVNYPMRLPFLSDLKPFQAQMWTAIICSSAVYTHETSHLSTPNYDPRKLLHTHIKIIFNLHPQRSSAFPRAIHKEEIQLLVWYFSTASKNKNTLLAHKSKTHLSRNTIKHAQKRRICTKLYNPKSWG